LEKHQGALTPEERERGEKYFHPGWEVEPISISEMKGIRGRKKPKFPVATATEYLISDSEEKEKWPQKMLLYTPKAGPETLAHEVGHIHLQHFEEPVRDVETQVKHEIQAWLWARKKRGKELQSHWLLTVIGNAVDDFPDVPAGRIVSAIVNTLEREGDPVSRQRRGAISNLVRWYKHKLEG